MKISDQQSPYTDPKVTPLSSDYFNAHSKCTCLISWPLVLLLDEPLIQTTSHSTMTAEDYQNMSIKSNFHHVTAVI